MFLPLTRTCAYSCNLLDLLQGSFSPLGPESRAPKKSSCWGEVQNGAKEESKICFTRVFSCAPFLICVTFVLTFSTPRAERSQEPIFGFFCPSLGRSTQMIAVAGPEDRRNTYRSCHTLRLEVCCSLLVLLSCMSVHFAASSCVH